MVVLPDHLHAVLRLPEGDDRYSMRWRMIKTDFTVRLRKQGIEFGERGNGSAAYGPGVSGSTRPATSKV